jgi:hypothetical protein
VHAALLANPSIAKPEKAANLEAAKKIFAAGDRNGAPYDQKLSELFADFDTGVLSQDAMAATTQKKTGFWGRTIK